jgi:hypothetical protein
MGIFDVKIKTYILRLVRPDVTWNLIQRSSIDSRYSLIEFWTFNFARHFIYSSGIRSELSKISKAMLEVVDMYFVMMSSSQRCSSHCETSLMTMMV